MKFIFANGKPMLLGGKPLAAVADIVAAPTTAIALTQFFVMPVAGYVGRFNVHTTAASNDTLGNVPIMFTYTGGAPSSIQARVVDSNGFAVKDWTDISASVNVNTTAGTGLGYLKDVPAGIGYKRQVRVGASGTITNADTGTFNVGIMMLPWGQSNMRGTLDGGIGRDNAVPGTALTERTFFETNGTGAFFGAGGFVTGENNSVTIGDYYLNNAGGSLLLRQVGSALEKKFGRKVGIAINPMAKNGQAMTAFMTTNSIIPMLTNTGTTANNISTNGNIGFATSFLNPQYASGDYRLVAWHQGESEQGATTNRAPRLADLKRFCQAHLDFVWNNFQRPPSKLTFLFAIMGVGNPTHMENLRGAVLDLVAYAQTVGWDVRVGWNCIDLDPRNSGDALHFGGLDQKRSISRLSHSAMHVMDDVACPKSAEGPRLTGAYVRTGDVVTLAVEHRSGQALTAKTPGSPITGWFANTAADFSGTDLTISDVTIVDATHIRVTVPGAPATYYLKHCGHKVFTNTNSNWPDVSNLIYDDFVYPSFKANGVEQINAAEQFTGLPLWPTPDPITVT